MTVVERPRTTWTDERLDDLSGGVTRMDNRLNGRIDRFEASVDARFEKFEASVDRRFAKLEASIDTRFDKVDERFANLESRFDKIDGTLHDMNRNMIVVLSAVLTIFGGIFAAAQF